MKLLDQVRQVARVKHFSYRTETAYAYWSERYIRFTKASREGTEPRQGKRFFCL